MSTFTAPEAESVSFGDLKEKLQMDVRLCVQQIRETARVCVC